MKISIVTIVLNGVKTIEATLNSVINQSYKNVEYILIDGGSTDGTLNVVQKYRKDISIFISERDDGLYDALNKGLRLATGDVVGILNADDFYANPSVLTDVVMRFNDPSVDIVFGDLEYFRQKKPDKVVRTYRSKWFSPKRLSYGIMPAHPTLFLRRCIYDKFGYFDPSYKIAGDFEFIVRIFKHQHLNFSYLSKIMVRMQLGGVSTSGIKSMLLINREIIRACKDNGVKTSYLQILLRYPIKLIEYFN